MGSGKGKTKRISSKVLSNYQFKTNTQSIDPNAWIKHCFDNDIANERMAEYYLGIGNVPDFIRDEEKASFAFTEYLHDIISNSVLMDQKGYIKFDNYKDYEIKIITYTSQDAPHASSKTELFQLIYIPTGKALSGFANPHTVEFFSASEVMCGHRLTDDGKNPGIATFAFEAISNLINNANS